jgi:hypothetical protein
MSFNHSLSLYFVSSLNSFFYPRDPFASLGSTGCPHHWAKLSENESVAAAAAAAIALVTPQSGKLETGFLDTTLYV